MVTIWSFEFYEDKCVLVFPTRAHFFSRRTEIKYIAVKRVYFQNTGGYRDEPKIWVEWTGTASKEKRDYFFIYNRVRVRELLLELKAKGVKVEIESWDSKEKKLLS
jgi:hypothetical protein